MKEGRPIGFKKTLCSTRIRTLLPKRVSDNGRRLESSAFYNLDEWRRACRAYDNRGIRKRWRASSSLGTRHCGSVSAQTIPLNQKRLDGFEVTVVRFLASLLFRCKCLFPCTLRNTGFQGCIAEILASTLIDLNGPNKKAWPSSHVSPIA